MQTIRAFIALSLPQDVKEQLGKTTTILSEQLPDQTVRWVKPELMHLTLRFLGETAVAKLPAIFTAMDQLSADHVPFDLTVQGLGCFPNCKRPRVIWAGVDGDKVALLALKQTVDEVLMPLGWPLEQRPFKSHLTIGRVKDSQKLRGVRWQADLPLMAVPITAVHFIESQLTPSGPIYTIKHTSQL